MRKYELYLISLSMLFLFVFFLTLPVCWSNECSFVGTSELFSNHLFSIVNLVLFLYSLLLIFKLNYKLGANNHPPFTVKSISNDSYEHLIFLVTYIIPLVAFDFNSYKYQILFVTLLVVIGYMYAKTDMYFSNPSLAILGYSIYKIEAEFRGNEIKSIIILSKDSIINGNQVSYIRITDNVYIGKVR